ncbi:hypothetical protein LIA77_08368 [Sarocladium implicatum]|nr:hypothetical protein LIA77_08368 [Sarocladium implicatum]
MFDLLPPRLRPAVLNNWPPQSTTRKSPAAVAVAVSPVLSLFLVSYLLIYSILLHHLLRPPRPLISACLWLWLSGSLARPQHSPAPSPPLSHLYKRGLFSHDPLPLSLRPSRTFSYILLDISLPLTFRLDIELHLNSIHFTSLHFTYIISLHLPHTLYLSAFAILPHALALRSPSLLLSSLALRRQSCRHVSWLSRRSHQRAVSSLSSLH